MNLPDCLQSLQGYGVALLNNGGGLIIQSASLTLTDTQKDIMKAHKPVLLAILPTGAAYPVGAVLDAVEAYLEREAIMLEAGEPAATVVGVAAEQARCVLCPG
jgi:hypothetical protein